VPEDREPAAVLGGPIEEAQELRLGPLCREAQVALLGQRHVHCGQRDLHEPERLVALEAPGAERARDPGTESNGVREADARVVAEAECLELGEIPVRIRSQVVVAVAADRTGERFEHSLLLAEAVRVVRCGVAPVEPDLGAQLEQRLDKTRPQALVAFRRRAVVRIVVRREDEEGGSRGAAAALLGHDLLEAPVRIRAAQSVQRCGRETGRLAHRRSEPDAEQVALQPRGGGAKPGARPTPRRVDVVGEGDDEACRPKSELLAETLERWIERVEARPFGAKAAVLVARAFSLLDAGEVKERLGQVVRIGTLAALDLLPGLGPVGNVVPEAELRRADGIQHPACAPLDGSGDHGSALRATRARCTSPGFGSSRAKTAST